MDCRETPRSLAASAWEIQSAGFRKILDIVNYLRSYEIACNSVQVQMIHCVSLRNTCGMKRDQRAAEILGKEPSYCTTYGAAFLGDSLELLKHVPDSSVELVFTSPPYALQFKKEYGNAQKADYVEWMLPFAKEILRVLKDDGSFVLNIGGSYNQGSPTRSLYHFHLLIALVEKLGFHLAQECFWYNPAKMPAPAEWVTVRRVRVRDSVEYVWWLSKTPWPKASNLSVLKEYSPDMIRLNKNGVKSAVRPSGHIIRSTFDKIHAGGSIPPNVIEAIFDTDLLSESMLKFGNNASNDAYTKRCKELGLKMHPARFPTALPEFFVRMLTDEGDLVVDPFAGSNTTGVVAEKLGRNWIAFERVPEYVEASRSRFDQLFEQPNRKSVTQAKLFG
jgi:DNA modification methylase